MLAETEQAMPDMLALPASSGQQRFWVLDQLKPADASMNVAVRFSLSGPLDVPALKRAMNEIVRRHEILRASFSMIDGQVVQLVAPSMTIPMPVADLRSIPEPERSAEADRLATEEAQQTFDLATAPLLRTGLLRVADDEHILLITIHHIVSDGWSIGVITDELGAIYEAFHAGADSPLPELAIQYADYTLWQQEHANELARMEHEAYWKRQLADLPQFEVMPDLPRTAGNAAIGHIVSRLLPVRLTGSMADLSRRHDATLFMTMFAAFTALLHRYTGDEDIVVGSQVVGRNAVEVEPLIGPFINTLVLRADASGDPGFEELLARVRQTVLEALAHQDLPVERVAEVLRVQRSADRNLLFQVNFIYQRDFVRPWEHAGVRMRPIPSMSPGAMYDLNVFLVERADGWRLSCEYNTALFREETVRRLLEHFENLLEAIGQDPTRPIGDYNFLTAREEDQILHAWNRTNTEYPRNAATHQLIEVQAQRTPDAVAVVCGPESVTYRELDRRANRLARALQRRGFARGDRAGICIHRSIEMLVSLLAVWKAGGAYVPLDPSFPPARLAFMADDSGLRLLLTTKSLAGHLNTAAPILVLDDAAAAEIAQEDDSSFDAGAGPDDLAYVIYTSGSTGKPKGVQIHHQALVNLLSAVLARPGLTADDVLLAVTTISFDIAGLELFAPLLAGARIVLASREQASDGVQLRNLLAASRATVLQATPATWRMLIDSGWRSADGLKMLCGGEPLARDLADALLERGGELWNMYGPTETTIWSSWCRVQRDGAPITIGPPAANTLFYIFDNHCRPVPAGVPGELYIGGEGVARGYLNRPELNAERFLANPFAEGRIYRTGDRARFRPDGIVEMLGRMDTQVKIRGFRIELGEVEAALAACPDVRNGAVVVREDASGEKALAGYFVPLRNGADVVDGLRRHLKQRLPDYMVPTYLVPLAALPQTPNGKLDRKALPAPETVRVETPAGSETPTDPLEAMLIAIWENVLAFQPIRKTDDFFEIGGHSVLAARLFARMEKVIGKTLPLATLFQAPTVEKLARLLRDGGWTPPWSSLVPIRPGGSKTPFYFVHPIGGNVLNFSGFASHFDADQPVYGLQARGLDGKSAPNTSIFQMARDYIAGIRSVQPEGPYYIGGFSAGGVVAYEMARQLRAQGQQVAVLALLDTPVNITAGSVAEASARTIARWIRTIRFNALYAFHIGLFVFARQKARNWRMRARIRFWMLRGSLTGRADPMDLDVEEAFLVALRNYVPAPYEGDATLFRAKDELVSNSDPTLGWGTLIQGRLEIREISGDHDTILYEPHIGMLARVLDSCLRAVQTSARGMKTMEQSA
ncbi:MAG: amino acid adenylation domain-containing protein [Bryobacteraceae bacterium]|jgi:aspartate racemase